MPRGSPSPRRISFPNNTSHITQFIAYSPWLRPTKHQARHHLTSDAACATHNHQAVARQTRRDEGPIAETAETAATTTQRPGTTRRGRRRHDDGALHPPPARAPAHGPSRRPLDALTQRGGAPHHAHDHQPRRRRTARGRSPSHQSLRRHRPRRSSSRRHRPSLRDARW